MDPLFLIISLCILIGTWVMDRALLKQAQAGAIVCYAAIAACTLLLFFFYMFEIHFMLPTQMVATYIVPGVKALLHIAD